MPHFIRYFRRPKHEDVEEEDETVVEDDAELTIDKLNDELAVKASLVFWYKCCF